MGEPPVEPQHEVVEEEPGRYHVRSAGTEVRVLVPAGVGVPGADDADVALACVRLLLEAGRSVPPVVDLSAELRRDPGLLAQLADRADRDA